MEETPEPEWQVAYDEAVLSFDGNSVIANRIGCAKGIREARIAFYFHYYDPTRPMRWTYGQFFAPAVPAIDPGLAQLLPYQPPG
jgi:hypothetical protein